MTSHVYKATTRAAAIAAGALIFVVLDAAAAMAQIVQSEVGAEPGSTETTQLVTSSTEVRRAVLGLLVIAGVVGLVTILYWYKTGQQARQRFARRYGGRHLAGRGDHDVVDERGPWATDASYQPSAYVEPAYAAAGPAPYPDRAPQSNAHQPGPQAARPTWPPQPQGATWNTPTPQADPQQAQPQPQPRPQPQRRRQAQTTPRQRPEFFE